MRTVKTLILISILSTLFTMKAGSQQPVKKYDKEWKAVEALVRKNLPKSALVEVKKIYDLSKKEKQDAQTIKALVYMSSLQVQTRENSEVLSIKEYEKEIAASKEPVTSILKSQLADRYWAYYQQNRWNLYDRTLTSDFKKEDPATWDATDFHTRISELYLQSIKEKKLLQQTRLEPFEAIIIKGNIRHLRPSLYDLLAHRALEYFENDERDIAKPAYAFEISQPSAFDPAADFIKARFVTRDSLSLQHKALQVYQDIIAFHLADPKPDALIDADLHRLQYVRTKSVHPEKDQLYLKALEQIGRKYGDLPAASQVWYLVAAFFEEKAASYKPHGDTTHRYDRIKARDICERILRQKDSSEGKINCHNLLNRINFPSLQFEIEKVNTPGQPFRALVNYRNVKTAHFRILKDIADLKENTDGFSDKYWAKLASTKPIRSWEQPLPATGDLQQHASEVKVEGLPPGEYMLLISDDKNFNNKKSILGARVFYSSSISFVNNGDDHFVLNRDNGQPLPKATVQVWRNEYDYKLSKYTRVKGKNYQTDANGFFRLEDYKNQKDNYRNNAYLLEISHHGETLYMNDWLYDLYYYRDNREQPKTVTSVFLFADRSLYRPGQTIYFKGIVLNRNSREKTGNVIEKYSTTLYLRDANTQVIDSILVTTNEFGSFSGKFQLPQAGLNGQFSLFTKKDRGEIYFRVEDYKRPKFYVDYEPVRGTYKINDTIKITGFAKAYAGNTIDAATVKFRVVREPRFLYPWLFWRWWHPPTAPMEIAHGEIKTGNDGKFIIEFKAIPDLSLDKKFEPVFDYRVYADVTDINGETRSGEKMVSVSYKSLLLKTNIPSLLAVDSLQKLYIRTENMNGEFEPARVNVTITKLEQEKRLIRERYWVRPDQFVMSKEEYIKAFPYDEYDNESDMKSWKTGQKVFEGSDSARVNGLWPVTNKKFDPGFYVVEITTRDKNGEEVRDIRYLELFDEKSRQLNKPQYLWSEGAKPIEPGETTSVKLGTTTDNLFVVQQRLEGTTRNPVRPGQPDDDQGSSSYSFVRLHNEIKSFDFKATEADRGGYGMSWIFVKHNRFYQYNQTIAVPWSNKELAIEYVTYRDKTLPGSEEKWKLKITGYKKELVAAEMLASMYDASLDQFYPHQWSQPAIWPSFSFLRIWNGDNNFLRVESTSRNILETGGKSLNKIYDQLLTINERGYYYFGNMLRGKVHGVVIMEEAAFTVPTIEALGNSKREDSVDDESDMSAQQPVPTEQGPEVQVRRNFNETAFFFPDLKTDSEGSIEFSFTIPEALTRWKFQALTHTKSLAFGYSTKEIVTQKQLMVQPNAPRFLREGDKMEFSTKIVNLSEKELTGQAELQLIDATTNQPIDGWFKNMMPNQYFTVAAGQSELVRFPIEVPYLFNKALIWRIVAKAGGFSDGEENALPVLTNRMLVTESLPLPMRGTGTKNFNFEKLTNSAKSESLQHHSLTLEYTTNPAWFAVQALPYMMEYPYDCAEQVWNRYYANSLASFIANASPRIRQVFERWKIADSAALMSNLQKNQELKAVLLEETPWVLQAKNETEQKKNIALLFDMVRMNNELDYSFEKLKQMQSSNGGFVWFKGGPDDRYITQYIITGIGHLQKLNGIAGSEQQNKLNQLLAKALPYLDRKISEEYTALIKNKTDLKKYIPDQTVIQYLYMRSFFPKNKIPAASEKAYQYFRNRVQKTWVQQTKYMQAMTALALHRTADTKTPAAILKSLKETSITHEELGMYWKDQRRGWFWFEAPVERQALVIEAFQEIARDLKTVDDLRTWLLKNKQTNNWESTKATAEACYALLLQGTEWLSAETSVEIKLGNTTVQSSDTKQEAGTGYIKTIIDGRNIDPAMGNITVTVKPGKPDGGKNAGEISSSWGAVYWQYFEDLDKITTAATPLRLVKKLFVEKNTDRGPVLTPVRDGDQLKVGDKIKVRVELTVDRDMEYVHMKDMRASSMEPVNVLSGYKWQGGLGYYETTRDASTNFFFNYLRKGVYVFEYPLFATHSGNFSNGITSIQCMYAPEFSAHSEGVRVSVE